MILITHYFAGALPIVENQSVIPQLLTFIVSGYMFKLMVALLDTAPLYVAVHYLSEYLQIDPVEEFKDEAETDQ